MFTPYEGPSETTVRCWTPADPDLGRVSRAELVTSKGTSKSRLAADNPFIAVTDIHHEVRKHINVDAHHYLFIGHKNTGPEVFILSAIAAHPDSGIDHLATTQHLHRYDDGTWRRWSLHSSGAGRGQVHLIATNKTKIENTKDYRIDKINTLLRIEVVDNLELTLYSELPVAVPYFAALMNRRRVNSSFRLNAPGTIHIFVPVYRGT